MIVRFAGNRSCDCAAKLWAINARQNPQQHDWKQADWLARVYNLNARNNAPKLNMETDEKGLAVEPTYRTSRSHAFCQSVHGTGNRNQYQASKVRL